MISFFDAAVADEKYHLKRFYSNVVLFHVGF